MKVNDVFYSDSMGKYEIKIVKKFPPKVSVMCNANSILSMECKEDTALNLLFKAPACSQTNEEISNFGSNEDSVVDSNLESLINAMVEVLKSNIDNGNVERLERIMKKSKERKTL